MKTARIIRYLMLFVSVPAFACICVLPPSPCQWYASHHGQPTFVGTTVAVETVSDVLRQGGGKPIVDAFGKTQLVTVQKVTFRAEESFEAIKTQYVEVYGWGTTCDYHFSIGARYLVYGWLGEDGKIRTGKCTRTAPLSEADEDLKFLRLLPTRIGGGIVGLVRFVSPGAHTGTTAGKVTASGHGSDHVTRVAASGWYELNGLAPGEYRETFTPDGDSTEFVSFKLSIPVNGSCASSGVRLGNATVSGSVVDETGAPISGKDVFLFYALDGHFHPDDALRTHTDADGRFSFHRVEAAKFILSAQLATARMIFFPGTHDSSAAQVIEVHDDKPLSGLAIRVPGASHSK